MRFTTSHEFQKIINEHYTHFRLFAQTYNFNLILFPLRRSWGQCVRLKRTSTKGVGSLQLIGKLFCWRRNVWVIVSRTITSILHLMKELCPIPLLWTQNVSQSLFYDFFFECTKSHFFFLAIVWWFFRNNKKIEKKTWNLFEQMRKNVSTWFFMSFHEWNILCSLIQHD